MADIKNNGEMWARDVIDYNVYRGMTVDQARSIKMGIEQKLCQKLAMMFIEAWKPEFDHKVVDFANNEFDIYKVGEMGEGWNFKWYQITAKQDIIKKLQNEVDRLKDLIKRQQFFNALLSERVVEGE